jgi:hypothetical protein
LERLAEKIVSGANLKNGKGKVVPMKTPAVR